MRRATIISAAALLLSVAPTLADNGVDSARETAIRTVITQQLDAFRQEDGVAAEAFAAPGIRDKFPDPNGFMEMVRKSYSALVRPKSTRFEALTQTGLGLVQKMTVVDSAGVVWTVAYAMTQIDGQWRISGCFVLKSDAVDT